MFESLEPGRSSFSTQPIHVAKVRGSEAVHAILGEYHQMLCFIRV